MTDYTQLMLAQLAPQFAAQNRPRDPYSARRNFGLGVLQQGMSGKPVSGAVEGLARALQAGLGGYLVHKTNQDQDTEEKGNASALAAALQAVDKDGKPDVSGMIAALARNPQHAGLAAMLQTANVMQQRQQGQAQETTRLITGGGGASPGGVPTGGASGAPPSFPQGPRAGVVRTDAGPDYDIPETFFTALQHGRNGSVPESGGQNIPNGVGSGAFGYFQIMPGTWDDTRRANPGLNLPADIRQATYEQQRAAIGAYHNQAAKILAGNGIPVTAGNLYLAQRFGADGAATLLRADPSTPIEQIVPPAWAAQNPDLRGPVGRFVQQAQQRFGDIQITPRGQPQQPPVTAPPSAPPVAPPVAAAPVEGGGVDDSGQDRGMSPGFATGTVPPMQGGDDGSRELAAYERLVQSPNADHQKMALQFYTIAQEKRAKAQQRRDKQTFEPPSEYLTPGGAIAVTEGGQYDPERIKREATAKSQGARSWAPATRNGKPGQIDTVTGEFKYDDAAFNEGQGKAATFADRQLHAQKVLDVFENMGVSGKGRFLEHVPMVGNYAQNPDYQRYVQARDNFINAQLRRESGAVISDKEYEDAYRIYMPRPGDDAAVLRQKKEVRELLARGMARDAGPAYQPPSLREVEPPSGPMPTPRGAPPPNHVEALKADPSLAAQFDEKYGPGASERVLKGGR